MVTIDEYLEYRKKRNNLIELFLWVGIPITLISIAIENYFKNIFDLTMVVLAGFVLLYTYFRYRSYDKKFDEMTKKDDATFRWWNNLPHEDRMKLYLKYTNKVE